MVRAQAVRVFLVGVVAEEPAVAAAGRCMGELVVTDLASALLAMLALRRAVVGVVAHRPLLALVPVARS